jgi:adenosine/AMP kinase
LLEFKVVKVEPPKDCNIILGMAHFIKTAEDLYEALVNAAPTIKFGLGFCESSGPCLVRHEGNDEELRVLAKQKAFEIACGHSFLIYIKTLTQSRMCPKSALSMRLQQIRLKF